MGQAYAVLLYKKLSREYIDSIITYAIGKQMTLHKFGESFVIGLIQLFII
jgi:hypothetical protein